MPLEHADVPVVIIESKIERLVLGGGCGLQRMIPAIIGRAFLALSAQARLGHGVLEQEA